MPMSITCTSVPRAQAACRISHTTEGRRHASHALTCSAPSTHGALALGFRRPAGPRRGSAVILSVFISTGSGDSTSANTGDDDLCHVEERDGVFRKNVGIMMINHRGEVFAAKRLDDPEATWQMPQGGIDEGECHLEAAQRELQEETSVSGCQIVGEHSRWLRYTYPTSVRCKHTGMWKQYAGQEQKWVVMKYTGSGDDIDIANCSEPEFSEWQWVQPGELPDQVVDFKKDVYNAVLEEFAPLLESMRDI